MDKKEHDRQSKEYLKARREARDAMTQADRAVHSEDSRVKYDPESGTLRQE